MANLQNLNIGIGANLGALNSGLSKASKKITSFAEGVEGQLNSLSTDRLSRGLANIDKGAVPAAGKLSSALGSVQTSTRSTTSAVINFNRVIQDAPFGIIGVANNIDPLVQSFNSLRAQTGSTTGALRTLLTSAFTGPGALITVFSLASTAALVFGDRLFGAGKKAGKASEEVEGLVEAADNLRKVLEQDSGYAEKIARQIRRNEQAIQIAERRAEIENKLENAARGTISLTEEQWQATKDQISATDELIASLGFEETSLKSLQKNLRSLQAQQEVYNGTIGTSETRLAAYVDELEGNAQRAIENFEAGITENTDELEQQRRQVGNTIRSFRQLARQGNEEARRAAIALMGVFEDLNGALEDSGVRAISVERTFEQMSLTTDEATESAKSFRDALDELGPMPEFSMGFETEGEPDEDSIAALEMQIQAFRNFRDTLDPASQGFKMLGKSIEKAEGELKNLKKENEETAEEGVKNADMLAMGFGRVAGAIIAGKKEALSFKNILGAILPGLLNVLFPGGGAAGGFLKGIFGGVFHDGGVVPGPLGKERLILAQGGETVMTPEQMRSGGGAKATINNYLQVDGRTIYLNSKDYQIGSNR